MVSSVSVLYRGKEEEAFGHERTAHDLLMLHHHPFLRPFLSIIVIISIPTTMTSSSVTRWVILVRRRRDVRLIVGGEGGRRRVWEVCGRARKAR
jgi:alcohol dehydrogenase class IV